MNVNDVNGIPIRWKDVKRWTKSLVDVFSWWMSGIQSKHKLLFESSSMDSLGRAPSQIVQWSNAQRSKWRHIYVYIYIYIISIYFKVYIHMHVHAQSSSLYLDLHRERWYMYCHFLGGLGEGWGMVDVGPFHLTLAGQVKKALLLVLIGSFTKQMQAGKAGVIRWPMIIILYIYIYLYIWTHTHTYIYIHIMYILKWKCERFT